MLNKLITYYIIDNKSISNIFIYKSINFLKTAFTQLASLELK